MHIKRIFGLVVFVGTLLNVTPASAHFQLLYTPNVNVNKAGEIPFKIIFRPETDSEALSFPGDVKWCDCV
jgi:uncharacterized GH25 family protein